MPSSNIIPDTDSGKESDSGKQHFVKPLQDRTDGAVGSCKRLECRVIGFPRPSIRWYKNGENITSHRRYKFDYSRDGYIVLIIENISQKDQGVYQCRADNSEGMASTSAKLHVKGAVSVTSDNTTTVHSMTFDDVDGGKVSKQSLRRPLVMEGGTMVEETVEEEEVTTVNRTTTRTVQDNVESTIVSYTETEAENTKSLKDNKTGSQVLERHVATHRTLETTSDSKTQRKGTGGKPQGVLSVGVTDDSYKAGTPDSGAGVSCSSPEGSAISRDDEELENEIRVLVETHKHGDARSRRWTTDSGIVSRCSSISSEQELNVSQDSVQEMQEYLHGRADVIYQSMERETDLSVDKKGTSMRMSEKLRSKTEATAYQTGDRNKKPLSRADEIKGSKKVNGINESEKSVLAGKYLFGEGPSEVVNDNGVHHSEFELVSHTEVTKFFGEDLTPERIQSRLQEYILEQKRSRVSEESHTQESTTKKSKTSRKTRDIPGLDEEDDSANRLEAVEVYGSMSVTASSGTPSIVEPLELDASLYEISEISFEGLEAKRPTISSERNQTEAKNATKLTKDDAAVVEGLSKSQSKELTEGPLSTKANVDSLSSNLRADASSETDTEKASSIQTEAGIVSKTSKVEASTRGVDDKEVSDSISEVPTDGASSAMSNQNKDAGKITTPSGDGLESPMSSQLESESQRSTDDDCSTKKAKNDKQNMIETSDNVDETDSSTTSQRRKQAEDEALLSIGSKEDTTQTSEIKDGEMANGSVGIDTSTKAGTGGSEQDDVMEWDLDVDRKEYTTETKAKQLRRLSAQDDVTKCMQKQLEARQQLEVGQGIMKTETGSMKFDSVTDEQEFDLDVDRSEELMLTSKQRFQKSRIQEDKLTGSPVDGDAATQTLTHTESEEILEDGEGYTVTKKTVTTKTVTQHSQPSSTDTSENTVTVDNIVQKSVRITDSSMSDLAGRFEKAEIESDESKDNLADNKQIKDGANLDSNKEVKLRKESLGADISITTETSFKDEILTVSIDESSDSKQIDGDNKNKSLEKQKPSANVQDITPENLEEIESTKTSQVNDVTETTTKTKTTRLITKTSLESATAEQDCHNIESVTEVQKSSNRKMVEASMVTVSELEDISSTIEITSQLQATGEDEVEDDYIMGGNGVHRLIDTLCEIPNIINMGNIEVRPKTDLVTEQHAIKISSGEAQNNKDDAEGGTVFEETTTIETETATKTTSLVTTETTQTSISKVSVQEKTISHSMQTEDQINTMQVNASVDETDMAEKVNSLDLHSDVQESLKQTAVVESSTETILSTSDSGEMCKATTSLEENVEKVSTVEEIDVKDGSQNIDKKTELKVEEETASTLDDTLSKEQKDRSVEKIDSETDKDERKQSITDSNQSRKADIEEETTESASEKQQTVNSTKEAKIEERFKPVKASESGDAILTAEDEVTETITKAEQKQTETDIDEVDMILEPKTSGEADMSLSGSPQNQTGNVEEKKESQPTMKTEEAVEKPPTQETKAVDTAKTKEKSPLKTEDAAVEEGIEEKKEDRQTLKPEESVKEPSTQETKVVDTAKTKEKSPPKTEDAAVEEGIEEKKEDRQTLKTEETVTEPSTQETKAVDTAKTKEKSPPKTEDAAVVKDLQKEEEQPKESSNDDVQTPSEPAVDDSDSKLNKPADDQTQVGLEGAVPLTEEKKVSPGSLKKEPMSEPKISTESELDSKEKSPTMLQAVEADSSKKQDSSAVESDKSSRKVVDQDKKLSPVVKEDVVDASVSPVQKDLPLKDSKKPQVTPKQESEKAKKVDEENQTQPKAKETESAAKLKTSSVETHASPKADPAAVPRESVDVKMDDTQKAKPSPEVQVEALTSDVTVNEDEAFTLQWRIKASSTTDIQMVKNDEVLFPDDRILFDCQDNICSVNVTKATLDDGANYGIKADNCDILFGKISVQVTSPDRSDYEQPEFVKEPTLEMSEKRLSLQCIVSGTPEPEVTWFKSGQQLREDKLWTVFTKDDYHCAEADHSAVIDQELIVCRVENEAGFIQTVVSLRKDGKELVCERMSKPEVTQTEAENKLPPQLEIQLSETDDTKLRKFVLSEKYIDKINMVTMDTGETVHVLAANLGDEMMIRSVKNNAKVCFVPLSTVHAAEQLGSEPTGGARDVNDSESADVIPEQKNLADDKQRKPTGDTETDTMPERQKMKSPSPKLHSTPKKKSEDQSNLELQSRLGHKDISVSAKGSVSRDAVTLVAEYEDGTTRPMFKKRLKKLVAKAGEEARLECMVVGTPLPKVLWLKNNRPLKETDGCKVIVEDETNILVFPSANEDDVGVYTARAMNVNGSVMCSTDVSLSDGKIALPCDKVPDCPMDLDFTTPAYFFQMSSCQVSEGRLARFDCRVVAYPKPEIVWMRDGKVVESVDRFKLLNFNNEIYSLLIQNVQLTDTGRYTCWARNKFGEAMTEAYLNVISLKEQQDEGDLAPKFLTRFYDQQTTESVPVDFKCLIAGRPAPSVTWLLDDIEIKESPSVRMRKNDGVLSLEIKSPKMNQSGQYTCQLKNELGDATCSARLTVVEDTLHGKMLPKFLKKFDHTTTRENEDITFTAVIVGEPKPKVTWMFDHKPIDETNRRYRMKQEGDTFTLTIKNVRFDDDGIVTCKAANDEGEVYCSANVHVRESAKVKETPDKVGMKPSKDSKRGLSPGYKSDDSKFGYVPTFTRRLQDQLVKEGTRARFECQVMGIPDPEVSWMKDGRVILPSGRYHMRRDGVTCYLDIDNATTADGGIYTCIVANPQGKASSSASLKMGDEKRKEKYTPEKFTPEKYVPDRYTPDKYTPEKYVPDRYTPDKYTPERFTPDRYLDDYVSPSKRPHLASSAEAIPKLTFERPTLLNKREDSVRLSWLPATTATLPTDGRRVSYVVESREIPGREWTRAASNVTGSSHNIRNLRPDKEYEFRVRAQNQYGVSEPTRTTHMEKRVDERKYLDLPEVRAPPRLPTHRPIITDFGEETVRLAWRPVETYKAKRIPPVSYRLEAKELPGKDWMPLSSRLRDTTHYLSELPQDRDYMIRVRAENDFGVSEPTESLWLPRAKAFPGVPVSRPEFVEVEPTRAKLSWSRVSIPSFGLNETPLTYMLEVEEPTTRDWRVVARDLDDTEYMVEGLRPKTDYRFRVRAKSPTGVISEPSPTASLYSALARSRAPVDNLEVVRYEPDVGSAQLQWQRIEVPPYSSDDEPLMYMLEYQEPPLTDWRTLVTGIPTTRYRVTNLAPDTDYRFRVRALTPYGVSQPSPVLPVSLKPGLPVGRAQPMLHLSDVEPEAVRLTWRRPMYDLSENLVYDVEMNEPPRMAWRPVVTGMSDMTYRVSGLRPTKDYQFRVLPRTPTRSLDYTSPVSLTTSEVRPRFHLSEPKLRELGPDSVQMTWSPAELPGYQRKPTSIYYSIDMNEEPGSSWVPVTRRVPDTRYVVTGLRPDHDYRFRVIAHTDYSASEPSTAAVLMRRPVPIFVRDEPKITDMSQSYVSLSWKPAELPIGKGLPGSVSYLVETQSPPGISTTWNTLYSSHPSSSVRLSDLRPDLDYNVRVRAKYGEYFTEPTLPVYIPRRAVPPRMPVEQPYAVDICPESVQLQWRSADLPIHILDYAPVTYRLEAQELPGADWVTVARGVPHTDFRVTGLNAGKDYAFRIRAENDYGLSEPTKATTIHKRSATGTHVAPNLPHDEPLMYDVGTGCVRLSWRPASIPSHIHSSSPITYTIFVQELPHTTWRPLVRRIPHTSYFVTGLLPDREYYFRIQADNEYGSSRPTESVYLPRLADFKRPISMPEISDYTDDQTSVKLRWKPTKHVPYKTQPKYNVESWEPMKREWKSIARGIPDTSYHVRSLPTVPDHLFRVRMETEHGLSEPSLPVSVSKYYSAPRFPIQRPQLHDLDSESVRLTWQPVRHDGDRPLRPVRYIIEQRDIPEKTWRPLASDVMDTRYKVTGLRPRIDYEFRIRALVDGKSSEPSYPVSLYRKAEIPSVRFDRPEVYDIDDDSVALRWRAVDVPAFSKFDEPLLYVIERQQLPNYEWKTVATDLTDTNYRIKGLKPLQDYVFRVRGMYPSGFTEPSPHVPVYRRPSESNKQSTSTSATVSTTLPSYGIKSSLTYEHSSQSRKARQERRSKSFDVDMYSASRSTSLPETYTAVQPSPRVSLPRDSPSRYRSMSPAVERKTRKRRTRKSESPTFTAPYPLPEPKLYKYEPPKVPQPAGPRASVFRRRHSDVGLYLTEKSTSVPTHTGPTYREELLEERRQILLKSTQRHIERAKSFDKTSRLSSPSPMRVPSYSPPEKSVADRYEEIKLRYASPYRRRRSFSLEKSPEPYTSDYTSNRSRNTSTSYQYRTRARSQDATYIADDSTYSQTTSAADTTYFIVKDEMNRNKTEMLPHVSRVDMPIRYPQRSLSQEREPGYLMMSSFSLLDSAYAIPRPHTTKEPLVKPYVMESSPTVQYPTKRSRTRRSFLKTGGSSISRSRSRSPSPHSRSRSRSLTQWESLSRSVAHSIAKFDESKSKTQSPSRAKSYRGSSVSEEGGTTIYFVKSTSPKPFSGEYGSSQLEKSRELIKTYDKYGIVPPSSDTSRVKKTKKSSSFSVTSSSFSLSSIAAASSSAAASKKPITHGTPSSSFSITKPSPTKTDVKSKPSKPLTAAPASGKVTSTLAQSSKKVTKDYYKSVGSAKPQSSAELRAKIDPRLLAMAPSIGKDPRGSQSSPSSDKTSMPRDVRNTSSTYKYRTRSKAMSFCV